MMAPARCCVPGERLCSLEDCAPGYGTYCKHGYIFSSLSGYVVKKTDNGLMPVISVVRDTDSHLLPDVGAIVTCKVMSINPRFAKVQIMYLGTTALKNTFRGTIRKEDIRATEKDKVEVYKSFRPGDIVVAKVISLGDAQSNYLLTTAENELGVVVAHSEAGYPENLGCWRPLRTGLGIPGVHHGIQRSSAAIFVSPGPEGRFNVAWRFHGATMVPISWCEMQCPKTHMKEPRKVARVQPEFLQT